MKKLIALVAVCGFAFAMAACGKKAEDTTAKEGESVEAPAPPAPADTTATPADTTATPADTTAH